MHKKTWRIRKADISDAEALSACMYAAYKSYDARFMGAPLPPVTVDYAAEIKNYPVWVAESDGVLVGGLILLPEQDHMTIANIAVHPKFQGHGLGRGLLVFAETEAKHQGYSQLQLATHILLNENISLYNHLGWSETGRDTTRVFMKKEL